jgi:hypothetical protein
MGKKITYMHKDYNYKCTEKEGEKLWSLLLNKTGVDVMITIFCDFRQFWAKKLAFFSKTNVMINFFS